MKRFLWLGLVTGALAAGAAEEKFSQAVRAEDYSAAGLAKLSPAELARLDALVRDYKSGALLAARREAEAAAQARAAAETRAAQAEVRAENAARAETAAKAEGAARAEAAARAANEAKETKESKSGPGLLARAKVLLTPGTEVEYATVESRIAGEFRGWGARTVFALENGQRWKVANADDYYTPAIASPKVSIVPAPIGGYWMTIEGVKPRVRVLPLVGK